ncbi:hypothetical protein CXB51_011621 [Gossypium anomalum]|uniref:Aminotransferase-like plant mobile domain-containing protein n=1 Tax=Gossypium anomalum TaxID=47600 RepID=A0A8J6D3D3_9ROSI|nr:hypothetical protein CXB51_011621 [Gossypium anomalum]
MQLQLGLSVDESSLTGFVQFADYGAICYDLLERIRYAWAYILEMIGGYLMPDLSRNIVHLRWLLKLVDFRVASEFVGVRWNYSVGYVGIPTTLEDIWLLLDQRSTTQFQWTLYEDPVIRVVIPNEFFKNLNIWHVKVSLVNYATVEMHQTDRVLRRFRFRQPISVVLEVLDDEHKIDLR